MRIHGKHGFETQYRLEVRLKDGRTLAGTYPFFGALARAEFAKTLPNYQSHTLQEHSHAR